VSHPLDELPPARAPRKLEAVPFPPIDDAYVDRWVAEDFGRSGLSRQTARCLAWLEMEFGARARRLRMMGL